MTNQKRKSEKPKQVLTPIDEESFDKNRRSAVGYYGKDNLEKLLKVTGGRVLHDYINH